jgi:hypothetical protein
MRWSQWGQPGAKPGPFRARTCNHESQSRIDMPRIYWQSLALDGESKGGNHVERLVHHRAIAATEGVDLWVLFPLGQAVNRWLAGTEDAPADRSGATESVAGANIGQNSVASSFSPRRSTSQDASARGDLSTHT